MSENDNVKVRVRNLTKCFGDLKVLDNVSFDIQKGDFVCIVGPTGCGKTTFLKCLVRLFSLTEGEILVDGEPADPKKHNLSFVFQNPSHLPWLTVEKNIRYGLELKKYPEQLIRERTEEILGLLGLDKVRNSYPHELSASTVQRIVIGRSFAMHPDLLLMDEPYGQMDIKMRYYLEDEVIKLWQATGSTVIFITHNIEEAVYLSDRILVLTNKPTKVKKEMINNLPRPRKISSDDFINLRNEVTELIKWW